MPDEKGKLSRSGAPKIVLVMNYSGVTDTSVKEAFRKAYEAKKMTTSKELVRQAVAELRQSEVPSDPRMRAVVALAALGECTAPGSNGHHEVYTDKRGPYCRACGVADIQPEIPITIEES